MFQSVSKVLVKDEVQARVDGSVGMGNHKEEHDHAQRHGTMVGLPVERYQCMIDLDRKPTNCKSCYYGNQHLYDLSFLAFEPLLMFVAKLSERFALPKVEKDDSVNNDHDG
jgi:hypothetical protein